LPIALDVSTTNSMMQITNEAEAMSKKPSSADKYYELSDLAKQFTASVTTTVEVVADLRS
jgi:hypothetical protein